MRITHNLSNTLGQATGTVTVPNLSGGTQTVQASAIPGPDAWNDKHLLSIALGGNTFGQSSSTGTEIIIAAQGQLRAGLSAGSLILAPSLATVYNEFKESPIVVGQVGQGSLALQRWNMPDIAFDRFILPVQASATTGQSGTATLSFHVGLYTLNGSSLSLWGSTSGSTSVSFQGTGNNSQITGLRLVSFPWSTTVSGLPGVFVGILTRTTTGGGAFSASNGLVSQINSGLNGFLGSTLSAGSVQLSLGQGVWTTTSTALPTSIALADIRATASAQMRPPQIVFQLGSS